jgi:hypothetical protein
MTSALLIIYADPQKSMAIERRLSRGRAVSYFLRSTENRSDVCLWQILLQKSVEGLREQ